MLQFMLQNLNINTKCYTHLQQYNPLNFRHLISILDVSFLSLYFDKPVKKQNAKVITVTTPFKNVKQLYFPRKQARTSYRELE